MTTRQDLLLQLPGANECDTSSQQHNREKDLDRMYERALRARITADDDEATRNDARRNKVLVPVACAVVIAAFIWLLIDRQRLQRVSERKNKNDSS